MVLKFITKFGYGVGHILNDLCASVWFTYALVYYNVIIGLSNIDSGLLLMIGQIVDGASTPLVGFISDRLAISRFLFDKYGKRKTWHLIGTVGIIITMPLMFTPCINCGSISDVYKSVYYAVLITIFQICWAIVQISHLSHASDLTLDPNERTVLLSYRTIFAVLSNMTVYSVAWIVLAGDDTNNASKHLSSSDSIQFQIIVYTIVVAGFIMSIIYHIIVKEKTNNEDSELATLERRPIKTLFKSIELYKVGVVYMCARLYGNMIQVMIPFYVHEVMVIGVSSIAVIPFVMYVSSFLTSLYVGPLNKKIGRKWSFCLGSFYGSIGITAILVGVGKFYTEYIIYSTVIFLGGCQSVYLITGLATIADFIGDDVNNGAFVFGIMSLTDKLSSGITIVVLQALKPDIITNTAGELAKFYKLAIFFSCGSAIVVGTVTILLMRNKTNPKNNPPNNGN